MKQSLDNQELMTRFLLGKVSDEERMDIEAQSFDDDRFFEQLVIAEEELIDAYARGELKGSERALFEQEFLRTPERRARLEFARGLIEAASAAPAPLATKEPAPRVSFWQSVFGGLRVRGPALPLALAAIILVLVLGVVWLLIKRTRPGADPQQVKQEQPAPPPQPTPTPLLAVEPEPAPPMRPSTDEPPPPATAQDNRPPARREIPAKRAGTTIATLTLAPGLVREGSAANSLSLPTGVERLRLRLTLEADSHESYRARLSDPAGREVWSGRAAKSVSPRPATTVTATLPARLLPAGDYIIELSGQTTGGQFEQVAEYAFRIIRR